MKRLPDTPAVKKTLSIMDYMSSLRIGINGSSTCYFIVLSLFPFLLLILSLLRYTGLEVEHLTSLLSRILPKTMMPSVERLVVSTYRSSSGTLVSVSAAMALWTASRGVYGILIGLNVVYHVEEDRSLFYTRVVSVLYTFAFLVVLILTLVLNVFGDVIMEHISAEKGPLWFLDQAINLRFSVMLLLQTLLFTAVYMVFPNKHNRFWESLPGAVLTSLGWLVVSNLFSIYMEYFPNYANIYGSMTAVALGMLWLYMCINIVFYGGVLNHHLAQFYKKRAEKKASDTEETEEEL
ncbi:MAG: YihY/virulence factor BrkB family protein [Oscillospiraceae bacterium]|nr:YihY/virulence factor BrkB family protein [Oscillospiraceae bacterium]